MNTTPRAHTRESNHGSDGTAPCTVQLVAYHFPPDREVGALRPAKIARSFLERGCFVNVIAGPGEARYNEDRLAVLRIAPSLDPRAWYSGRRRSRTDLAASERSLQSKDNLHHGDWVPPDRVPVWKRYLSSLIWLPDDRQGWILPAARAAIQGIHKGVSVLYTSAPPHSVHLVGLLAKWRTGIFWVAEFRDPWTDNPGKPAFVRSRWSDALERWLETRCLRKADVIVTVTDSFANRIRQRLPQERHDRVIVIRNGIDELAPAPAEPDRGSIDMLYVGNLYHSRDPRPFFRALGELNRQKRLPSGARVEFIGDCETFKGVPLAAMLEEYGIGDRVTIRGRIAHDECLRRIAGADLLLLFAQDQPLQVPNKLYEYLGARRPIVAFVDPGGETARMLGKAGRHFTIESDDPAHICGVLESAFRNAHRLQADDRVLQEWTTERQLAALHSALGTAQP
jgi:glycosyltransferase involved in cell wall biosynthesis